MQLSDLKAQIVGTLLKEVGHQEFTFKEPVIVKPTPHTRPVYIHMISISPNGDIWVFTSDCEWYKVEETDLNYNLVIPSLYQRVTYLFGHKTAVA